MSGAETHVKRDRHRLMLWAPGRTCCELGAVELGRLSKKQASGAGEVGVETGGGGGGEKGRGGGKVMSQNSGECLSPFLQRQRDPRPGGSIYSTNAY